MRIKPLLILGCLFLSPVTWRLAGATVPPSSGQWRIVVNLDHRVEGADEKSAQLCMTSALLETEPEKAFIEASWKIHQRGGPLAEKLSCELTGFERNEDSAKWLVSCKNSKGMIRGTGSSTMKSTNEVEIRHNFEINTPLGKYILKQAVQAHRMGGCS
jgi:Protein of unknown function (DUF3617)